MKDREVEVEYRGFVFRLPQDVSDRLKRLAELNGRSIEDEFIAGLQNHKCANSSSFLPSKC